MRIYASSLSDYNAGILHGAWFNLADYNDSEELYDAIKKQVLENSPTAKAEGLPAAEEFAIHDYDDAHPEGLGEYESLAYLMDIQDCLNKCIDRGIDEEAFCAWWTEISGVHSSADFDSFEDVYCGKYDSKEDFAYDLIEQSGILDDVPETLFNYFDYEAYARDLFLDGYTMTEDGYVFADY